MDKKEAGGCSLNVLFEELTRDYDESAFWYLYGRGVFCSVEGRQKTMVGVGGEESISRVEEGMRKDRASEPTNKKSGHTASAPSETFLRSIKITISRPALADSAKRRSAESR